MLLQVGGGGGVGGGDWVTVISPVKQAKLSNLPEWVSVLFEHCSV